MSHISLQLKTAKSTKQKPYLIKKSQTDNFIFNAIIIISAIIGLYVEMYVEISMIGKVPHVKIYESCVVPYSC
jgi:hypothetical protein